MKNHQSHIGSSRSKARGWRRIPPPWIKRKTARLIKKQQE